MRNPYLPRIAKVTHVREEAPNIRTYRLSLEGSMEFTPGQFIELTVFGYGEAPFSISSSPLKKDSLEITVRRMGVVTKALFNASIGDVVGVRGSFGNGWPLQKLKGENLVLIAGGIGIAPLRPLIEYICFRPGDFGDVVLLYGARTPKDIVYKDELEKWGRTIDVRVTVDVGDAEWRGRTGVVTKLLDEVKLDPKETYALQCGPPIMMHFATRKLVEMGYPSDRIVFSLERLMKCGMGFCGHCMVSGRFVCKDGPVFTYQEVESFLEHAV